MQWFAAYRLVVGDLGFLRVLDLVVDGVVEVADGTYSAVEACYRKGRCQAAYLPDYRRNRAVMRYGAAVANLVELGDVVTVMDVVAAAVAEETANNAGGTLDGA